MGTSDMLDVMGAMNAVLGELQGLSTEAKSLCSYDANMDTSDGKILCQDMEEKMKLSEKRVNRCAARLSDYLASTAKIDALIVEKKRRFALLDSLDKFTDSISGAWSAVQYEGDDDFVEEPSTRFNLTEHVTTGIVHTLMNHYTTVSARRSPPPKSKNPRFARTSFQDFSSLSSAPASSAATSRVRRPTAPSSPVASSRTGPPTFYSSSASPSAPAPRSP